jgi:hypothetical protein
MKLENATLALEPRSVGECIDLAVLFYRRHASKLLTMSLLFGGVPVAAGVVASRGGTGWLWSGVSFFLVSPFLGASVIAGAGHHVFGEDFTVGNALRQVSSRLVTLLVALPAARLAVAAVSLTCWGVLTVPVAARYGFLSEVVILEQLERYRIAKRCEEILRDVWVEACGRYAAIAGFAFGLSIVLFLLFDLGSRALFGIPVFVAKISWAVAADDVVNLLAYDPLVVGVLSATCWLVYPLARLAWFFCYLDARVRKEGWDVEIALRVEARRLQHAY